MEMSNLLALGSAFVAGLAALYASWSARAAQRTNEIAIHNEAVEGLSICARLRCSRILKRPWYSRRKRVALS
jgi:hypothetical protein